MEQSSMEEIYRLLNAGNRILVTDFDKTITEIGSSIYASVHVLGKNSSFGQARDCLLYTSDTHGRKTGNHLCAWSGGAVG